MKQLRNEKGVALVMSLMFTLICLGMILMLLYSVLSSVKSTGAQARYRSSLEASYGGVEFVTKTAIERVFENYSTGKRSLISDFGDASDRFGLIVHDSLREKMHTATANWTGDAASKSVNPKVSPDLEFMLPGASGTPTYKIYSKVTDTVPGIGMLDDSGIDYLDAGLAVVGIGNPTAMRTPTMYTIEVLGESAVRSKEKANLTVLYAY